MNLDQLTLKLLDFRKKRDWEQFHNPKNLAVSISIEANEILEHFQWLSPEESDEYARDNKAELAEEMADVLNYLTLLAHDLNIDLIKAAKDKVDINEKKYPVQKSKGSSKKYTKF